MKINARPWSKLQKRLYNLISDDINLQIQCVVYKMNSNYGNTGLPRYFITLDKDIIWDYPSDFRTDKTGNEIIKDYPHINDISTISDLIEEYINTGNDELSEKVFENDLWNLTDILKAADRRMGKRRLEVLKDKKEYDAAKNIASKRINL